MLVGGAPVAFMESLCRGAAAFGSTVAGERSANTRVFERNGAGFEAEFGEDGIDDEAGDEAPEHGGLVVGLELRRDREIGQNANDEPNGPRRIAGPVDTFPRTLPLLD